MRAKDSAPETGGASARAVPQLTRSPEMPAIKLSAVSVAGLAVSAFLTPAFCSAATLVVNREQPVQISTSPGFNYQVQGGNGSLTVDTEGWLFCANVPDAPQTQVSLVPRHGSWRMPVAQDVSTVSYSSGALYVNRSPSPTLVCHGVGSQGETTSALTEGLFKNAFESKTIEQYANLVNWISTPGFDWTLASNWTQVPTDPCNPTANQPAQVSEPTLCAAATGVRSGAVGGSVRAATAWTATPDGSNFYYVVRIDARYGAQGEFNVPAAPLFDGEQSEDAGSVDVSIIDAYNRGDQGVGGYLGDTGQWCALTDLPQGLAPNVCANATASGTLSGPLGTDGAHALSLHLGPPPTQTPARSFYMVFIRPIVGPPPDGGEPAVAVTVLTEPSAIAEGGDRFRGDDVVFGFLPGSSGFPWMSGQ
ncbi:MAG TPA: hypothetical protein VHE32_04740 [Rhodanobacteraceae bacterium]|nr:hypothetical protein [Rhodanobacteraceae bacterium]